MMKLFLLWSWKITLVSVVNAEIIFNVLLIISVVSVVNHGIIFNVVMQVSAVSVVNE